MARLIAVLVQLAQLLAPVIRPFLTDKVLAVAGPLVAAAYVGTQYLPPHTIGYQVCVAAVAIGLALGVSATATKEGKPKPTNAEEAAEALKR